MSLNLSISPKAARFYQQELNLQQGQAVRLFVRIGGFGCGGFSMGVQPAKPKTDDHIVQVDGVQFCVCPDDAWYMEGLLVDYHEKHGIHYESGLFEDLLNPVVPQEKIRVAV